MPPKKNSNSGWSTPVTDGNKKQKNGGGNSASASKGVSRSLSPCGSAHNGGGGGGYSSSGMRTPNRQCGNGGGWSSNSSQARTPHSASKHSNNNNNRNHNHGSGHGGGGGGSNQQQHQHQFQLLPSLSAAVAVVSSQPYIALTVQSVAAYANVPYDPSASTTTTAASTSGPITAADRAATSQVHVKESSSAASAAVDAILSLPASISQAHQNPTQHNNGPPVTAFTRQEITTMRHELDLLIHDVTMSSAESGGGGGNNGDGSGGSTMMKAKDNLCAATLAEWLGYRPPLLDAALAEAVRDLEAAASANNTNTKKGDAATTAPTSTASHSRVSHAAIPLQFRLPFIRFIATDALPTIVGDLGELVPQLLAARFSDAVPQRYQEAVTNCYGIACILRLVAGFLFVWGSLGKVSGSAATTSASDIRGRAAEEGEGEAEAGNGGAASPPTATGTSRRSNTNSNSASSSSLLDKALGPQLSRHFAFAHRQRKFSQDAVAAALKEDVDPFIVTSMIGSLIARCSKLSTIGLEASAVMTGEIRTAATFPEDAEAVLVEGGENATAAIRNKMRLNLALRMVRHSALLCLYVMNTAAPNAVFNHWSSLFPTTVPTHFNLVGYSGTAGAPASSAGASDKKSSSSSSSSPLIAMLTKRAPLRACLKGGPALAAFFSTQQKKSADNSSNTNDRSDDIKSTIKAAMSSPPSHQQQQRSSQQSAASNTNNNNMNMIGGKHPLFAAMLYDPSLSNRSLAATLVTCCFQQSYTRLSIAMEPSGTYGLAAVRADLRRMLLEEQQQQQQHDGEAEKADDEPEKNGTSSRRSNHHHHQLLRTVNALALTNPSANYTNISVLLGHVVYSTHIAFRQAILDGMDALMEGGGAIIGNKKSPFFSSSTTAEGAGMIAVSPHVLTMRSAWRSLLFHHFGTIVSLSGYQHCPRSAEVLASFFQSGAAAATTTTASSSPSSSSLIASLDSELSQALHGILVRAMQPVLAVVTVAGGDHDGTGGGDTSSSHHHPPHSNSSGGGGRVKIQRESNGDEFDSASSTSAQFFAPAERVSGVRLLHTLWKVKSLSAQISGSWMRRDSLAARELIGALLCTVGGVGYPHAYGSSESAASSSSALCATLTPCSARAMATAAKVFPWAWTVYFREMLLTIQRLVWATVTEIPQPRNSNAPSNAERFSRNANHNNASLAATTTAANSSAAVAQRVRSAAMASLPPAMRRLSPEDLVLTAVEAFKGLISYFGYEWAGVGLYASSTVSAAAATAKPIVVPSLSSSSSSSGGGGAGHLTTVAGLLTAGASASLLSASSVKQITALLSSLGVVPLSSPSSAANDPTAAAAALAIPLPFTPSPLIGSGDFDLPAAMCEEGSLAIRQYQQALWEDTMAKRVVDMVAKEEERRRRAVASASGDGNANDESVGGGIIKRRSRSNSSNASMESSTTNMSIGSSGGSSTNSDDTNNGGGGNHPNASSMATAAGGGGVGSIPADSDGGEESLNRRGGGGAADPFAAQSQWGAIMGYSLPPPPHHANGSGGGIGSGGGNGSAIGGGSSASVSPPSAHHHNHNNNHIGASSSSVSARRIVAGEVSSSEAPSSSVISSSASSSSGGGCGGGGVGTRAGSEASNADANGDGGLSQGGGGGRVATGKRPSIASLLLDHRDFCVDELLGLLHEGENEPSAASAAAVGADGSSGAAGRRGSRPSSRAGSRSNSAHNNAAAASGGGGAAVGVIGGGNNNTSTTPFGKSVRFADPTAATASMMMGGGAAHAAGSDYAVSPAVSLATAKQQRQQKASEGDDDADDNDHDTNGDHNNNSLSLQGHRRDKDLKQYQRLVWLQQAKLLAMAKVAVPLLLPTNTDGGAFGPSGDGIVGGAPSSSSSSPLPIRFSPLLIALAIRFLAQLSQSIFLNPKLVSEETRDALVSAVVSCLPSGTGSNNYHHSLLFPNDPCIRIEALSAVAAWAVAYPQLRPLLSVSSAGVVSTTTAPTTTNTTTSAAGPSGSSPASGHAPSPPSSSFSSATFFSDCARRVAYAVYSDSSILVRNKAIQTLAILCEVNVRHCASVGKLKSAYFNSFAARFGLLERFTKEKESDASSTSTLPVFIEGGGGGGSAASATHTHDDNDDDLIVNPSSSTTTAASKAQRKATRTAALNAANASHSNSALLGGSGGDDSGELLSAEGDIRIKGLWFGGGYGAGAGNGSAPTFLDSDADDNDGDADDDSVVTAKQRVARRQNRAVATAVADRLWREAFLITGAAAGINNGLASSASASAVGGAAASLASALRKQPSPSSPGVGGGSGAGAPLDTDGSLAELANVTFNTNAADDTMSAAAAAVVPVKCVSSSDHHHSSSAASSSSSASLWYAVSFAPSLLTRADLETILDAATYAFDCPKATHIPRNALSATVLAAAANRDAIVGRLLRDGVFGNPAEGDSRVGGGGGGLDSGSKTPTDGSLSSTTAGTTVDGGDLGRFGAYRVGKVTEDAALPSIREGHHSHTTDSSTASSSSSSKAIPTAVTLPTHVSAGLEALFTPSTTPSALRALTFGALALSPEDHFMFMTDYSKPSSFVNAVVGSFVQQQPSATTSNAAGGGGYNGGRNNSYANANNGSAATTTTLVIDPLFAPLSLATGAVVSATTAAAAGPFTSHSHSHSNNHHTHVVSNPYLTLPRISHAVAMALSEAHEEGVAAMLMSFVHASLTHCREGKDRAAAAGLCGLLLSSAGQGLVESDPSRLVTLVKDLVVIVATDSVYAVRCKAAAALGAMAPSITALLEKMGGGGGDNQASSAMGGGGGFSGGGSSANSVATTAFNPFGSGGAVQRSPILSAAAAPSSALPPPLPGSSSNTNNESSSSSSSPHPTIAVIFKALCGALERCDHTETFAQFRDVDLLKASLVASIRLIVRRAPPSTAFQQALFQNYGLLDREGLL